MDLDLGTFEACAVLFFDSSTKGDESRAILKQAASQPLSVLIFSDFITRCQSPQAEFLCATIVSSNIGSQWEDLTPNQREGLKTLYFNLVFEYSDRRPEIVQQLNAVLVHILFEEWPQNWPSFLSQLIERAKTQRENALNAIRILEMLSLEVRTTSIHSVREKQLVTALHKYFHVVFGLFHAIFTTIDDLELRRMSFECLAEYLGWIDLKLISFDLVVDALFECALANPELRETGLKCILAVITQESLTADPMMHLLLQRFMDFVSTDIGMLVNPEWIEMFVAVLVKFVCLDRCALMPNDSLIQWMIEYTRFVEDELFSNIIEMWLYLAMTCMIDGTSLPFSAQYLVPLQAVFCQRMAKPEEFGGEEGLFEKMGNTLKMLCKVRHGQILEMLIQGVKVDHFHGDVLPLFFTVGAITGVCRVEEEEVLVSTAIESILNWVSQGEEIAFSVSLYLFVISLNIRYLYHHPDIFEITLQKMVECFQNDSILVKTVAVSAFKRLSASRLFTETGFAMKVLEQVETLLRMIPEELHTQFYEGLTILAKSCQDPQQKYAVIVTLFKYCSSLDILAQLIPIADASFQEPIEALMTKFLEEMESVTDRHPYYVIFESMLNVFPKTALRDRLVECFMRHKDDSESLDCLAVMIKSGHTDLIPMVCTEIVEPVFNMINTEFTELPDIRLSFFNLVKAILSDPGSVNTQTFSVLFKYMFYGLNHPQHEISEMSLNSITAILAAVSENPDNSFVTGFYETFYWSIMNELIAVATDGLHKPLFSVLTHALHHMLHLVSSGKIQFISGEELVAAILERLKTLFPHVNTEELQRISIDIVSGATNCEKLRTVMNDFVITSERTGDENPLDDITEQTDFDFVNEFPDEDLNIGSGDSDLAEF